MDSSKMAPSEDSDRARIDSRLNKPLTTESPSNASGQPNSHGKERAREYASDSQSTCRRASYRAEHRDRRSQLLNRDQSEPEITLEYDEGLYSPTNLGGHRRYSNKFLRALGRNTRLKLVGFDAKIEPYSLDMLPYESGQYSPSNPEGDKKYSLKFLKAVGEMLMPDEDAHDVAPLLSDRSVFPWDMNLSGKPRQKTRTLSEAETTESSGDTWL